MMFFVLDFNDGCWLIIYFMILFISGMNVMVLMYLILVMSLFGERIGLDVGEIVCGKDILDI